MIHIGSLIREELHRQERTVSWFAKHLYCDRSNVYDIFKRANLDTELLFRISQLLQCDFFSHYSHELHAVNEAEEPADAGTITTEM